MTYQEISSQQTPPQAVLNPKFSANGTNEVLSFIGEKYSSIQQIMTIFCAIAGIPRASKQEQLMRDFVISIANEKGWEFRQDQAGNISVSVPGCGRGRHSEPVCLQGHMDMVTLPETFDFLNTPLSLKINQVEHQGGKSDALTADKTTLGADNGIAVATALQIALNPPRDCPPLILLFTADEETGLTGASDMDPALMCGAKKLLNLDSEEEGQVTISCAGGSGLESSITVDRGNMENFTPFKLRISGLPGGHSGVEINQGRGNANMILAKSLARLQETTELYLAEFNGGEKRNSIPDWANSIVWVANDAKTEFIKTAWVILAEEIKNGTKFGAEKYGFFELSKKDAPLPFAGNFSIDFITTFAAAHDGVYKMSSTIPGLVETSSNFGVVRTNGNTLSIVNNARSSSSTGTEEIQSVIKRSFEAIGFTTEYNSQYSGWSPNLSSNLLQRAEGVFLKLFEQPLTRRAEHAGLECGVILGKFAEGEIDAISFGPQINRAHTPDECLILSSVDTFQKFLRGLLADLC
jgi:dipeptidase D